ncbi:MAG: hypothetical protein ABEJ72_06425, partial [Candidatus Aenigmatarchaeota archaeon]
MGLKREILTILYLFRYTSSPISTLAGYLLGGEYTVTFPSGESVTSKRGEANLPFFAEAAKKGYTVRPYEEGYFLLERDRYTLIGKNKTSIEDEPYYDVIDIEGKNVLDVGGFLGETAVRFIAEAGADNVYVYEAVPEFAQKIPKSNGIGNRIHCMQKAVGDTELSTEDTQEAQCVSWGEAIRDAIVKDVYLAKVDCEGCEEGLLNVKADLLQEIPHWIMETHSSELTESIMEKF